MTVKVFFSVLLRCIGFLICFLSGGCTLIWLGMAAPNINSSALGISAIIGGIPFFIGMVLFSIGKALKPKNIRNAESSKPPDYHDF